MSDDGTSSPTSSAAQRAAGRGLVTTSVGFFLVMSFMTLPTPLYGLYRERDGFGSLTVTLVFAAYGAGVIVGLLLAGHVSDHRGRRPVLLTVVALEVLVAAGFALRVDVGSLLVLRLLSGIGVGGMTATATAAIGEQHARWRPGSSSPWGRLAANLANLGGLAAGPVIAGLLSLLPRPLAAPYAVYVPVLLVAGVLFATAPETVSSATRATPWRYRPQRIAIDPGVRTTFVGAAVAALAGFSVLGFITALTGEFLSDVAGVTARAEVGLVATAVLGGGVLSQLALARAGRRTQLKAGAVLLAVGVVAMAGAALGGSLAVYVVGGALGAGGNGLVLASAVATVAGLAAPERRSETLAAMFLAAYVGITIPVVLIGAALTVADVVPVLVGFAVVVLAVVPTGIAVVLRTTEAD